MARVAIQLVSDAGGLLSESTVIADVPIEEAERVMAAAVDAAIESGESTRQPGGCITEFHYVDRDVGAYDDLLGGKLWALFAKKHEPSHILIRPNTDRGQLLSNQLHCASKMSAALEALVDTINATGGVVRSNSGMFVPAADEDWPDLGAAYTAACDALAMTPMVTALY